MFVVLIIMAPLSGVGSARFTRDNLLASMNVHQDRLPAQTLNEWVKRAEVDGGARAGVSSDGSEKLKALEWKNRELRQANEILRKASAYFAMVELVGRFKS